jgi:hypothetical protein
MRPLWAGMLFASLPLALLAQNLDRRPLNYDSLSPRHAPPDNPAMESNPDQPIAPPQPDDPNDTTQDMMPNPPDEPNDQPTQATSRPSQPQTPPQGQPARGAWVQMGTATLQALDKVNAVSTTLVVKVGDTGHFGSLDIAVRGCFVRSPDQPADATAFLVIHDRRGDAPSFSGWMVRSAPSLSMMAHPIYDVRVAGCVP